ncbi:hypothetical protein BHE74_00047702 [Ensete ventricosum]|nr:hypothetical protein BHE74_00047702 [Ensete ventricosum]
MEVSPECGERSPTGKSVGVSEVEKEDIEEPIPGQRETKRERQRLVLGDTPGVSVFGSLSRAAKRVAAAWCWRHGIQNGASGCSFWPEEQQRREAMGYRSASLAVRYDIAGLIVAKQRKKERKQSNGPETAGANVPERWRGWRLGRQPGFRYSGERKDVKVAATVSALVGRLVLISLVPSVAEADVATVEGLESTIKYARDRKRWKLAVV